MSVPAHDITGPSTCVYMDVYNVLSRRCSPLRSTWSFCLTREDRKIYTKSMNIEYKKLTLILHIYSEQVDYIGMCVRVMVLTLVK